MDRQLLSRFPFGAFKGFERVQVEGILARVADAYGWCVREGGYGDDEEQLVDDMFDILKPSEDEELLVLRVVDAYLSLLAPQRDHYEEGSP